MSQRAALYARVSTAQQENEQTIASQVEALERAAASMSLTVPPERRYLDEGFSGSRVDRPALDALRDAAADGFLDVVLVYAPDRLARNFVHQQVILEELTRRQVHVHFVERPIGERAEDHLLVQMQGVIAEYERAKILERTRRGKIHKVRLGQMLPFQYPPYGYAIVRTPEAPHGLVVLDEVEAQHVRSMYRWVQEEGLTTWRVAKRLNDMGVQPRKKGLWVQTSVYRVLTNPVYSGFAVYNQNEPCEPKRPRRPGEYRKILHSSTRRRPESQWIRVPVPPIIDDKTQREVRARLAANRQMAPRTTRHEYLLRSFVICGGCGWRMSCIHTRSGDRQREYFYYACDHRDPIATGRTTRCTSKRVPAKELDAVVWGAIAAWIQSPQMLLQELEAWRSTRAGIDLKTRERVRVENLDHKLQLQIERLVDAYQCGALTIDELKARRERLEAQRSAQQLHLQQLIAAERDAVRVDQLAEDLATFAATLRSGLDALDFAGRRRLVHLLVERVVVKGDTVSIEHAIPLSGRFGGLSSRSLRTWKPARGGWRRGPGGGNRRCGRTRGGHGPGPG
jgi:site-specific DNA recombinase